MNVTCYGKPRLGKQAVKLHMPPALATYCGIVWADASFGLISTSHVALRLL